MTSRANAGYRHWTVIVFSHSQLPKDSSDPKNVDDIGGSSSTFPSISFNARGKRDEVSLCVRAVARTLRRRTCTV